MNLALLKSIRNPNNLKSPRRDLTLSFEGLDGRMPGFFGRPPSKFKTYNNTYIRPPIEVQEDDDKYSITAELPGVLEEDVTLKINDKILTLKGEKRINHESEEKDYLCSERSFGTFKRDIGFPQKIDIENVKAKIQDGMLSIECQKRNKGSTNRKIIPIEY